MNEIEKVVRNWIREIGRAKTRHKCNILDGYISKAVLHYDCATEYFESRVFGNVDPVITKDDLLVFEAYGSSGPYSQAFNKVTHANAEGV